MTILSYRSRVQPPCLGAFEVHTWCFSLLDCEDYGDQLNSLLSASERKRAATFRFEDDAARFCRSRGMLRMLLGKYLARLPQDVRITCDAFGKPAANDTNIQFNVSHTSDVVMFAFVLNTVVGIDVETRKEIAQMESVARHCLSSEQLDRFLQLDPQARGRAFYRFWTRKEALIKATGLGLSQPLKDFDVTFLDDEPPQLTRAVSGFGDTFAWSLHDLEVSDRHQAALAIQDREHKVRIIDSLVPNH